MWHVVLTVVRTLGKKDKKVISEDAMNNTSEAKEPRSVEITYCVE